MKKLLAILLLLCLAAACVPAGAEDSHPTGSIIDDGEGIIDLSNGPVSYTLTIPDLSNVHSEAEAYALYNEAYAQPAMVLFLSIEFAEELGLIKRVSESQSENVQQIRFDLDKDDTPDLIITATRNEKSQTLKIEADPDYSCGSSISIKVDIAPLLAQAESMPPFDMHYYSTLTFFFKGGTAKDKVGSYKIEAEGAVFVKPAKKDASSVKIPATVNFDGKAVPVTKIAPNAFKGNKKLTKITLGKNIKEIGKNAFANCAKLKTVSGGANLEIIGDSAFSGCKALKSFTIGAKVKSIGKKAFYKCAALKKLTIKSTLLNAKTVGANAFKGINASATIKVPKAVKKEYTKWLLKKGVKKTMKIK